MDGKVRVGKVSRLHGYKGEVSLKLDPEFIELFSDLDHIFLKIGGKPVPFFIDTCRYTAQGFALVFFEGVTTQSEAEKIRGSEIWVDEEMIPEQVMDENDPDSWIGYIVNDSVLGEVGVISSLVEHPGSVCLVVERDDGEVMIPIHDEIIKSIDHSSKIVSIEAPEGLIELNLE